MKQLLFICLAWCLAVNPVFGDNGREQKARARIAHAVRHEHYDAMMGALSAIKTNYNLSDDEFSELIVLVAEDYKTGEFAYLRRVPLAVLQDFGTTNALAYLRSEALQGPFHYSGAVFYALISGFDRSSFELARQVYSGEDPETTLENRFFCDLLLNVIESDGEYRGRKLARNAKELALEYIRDSAAKDVERPRYFDDLLLKVDPDYPNSELRKRRVTHFAETLPTNYYCYAYFQTELAKLKKAEQEAERKTAEAAIEEAEAESKIRLYSLITLSAAMAITAFLALRK